MRLAISHFRRLNIPDETIRFCAGKRSIPVNIVLERVALSLREKIPDKCLFVTILPGERRIRNDFVFIGLRPPFLKSRISGKITPELYLGAHRERIILRVLLKILPEIMRHCRPLIHLLRAEHAPERRIVIEHIITARIINVRRPGNIRELIVRRDLAA